MAQERYDQVLLQMASQHKDIEGLLNTFFSFMHRRTDFYVETSDRKASMGFPPGAAEALLLRSFRSLPMKPLQSGKNNTTSRSQRTQQAMRKSKSTHKAAASTATAAPRAPLPGTTATLKVASETKKAASSNNTISLSSVPQIKLNDEGKQVPLGNGGVTDRYYWTQTLYEVTVVVSVPVGVRSRDIECSIKRKHVRLGLKGASAPIMEGEFPESVKVDDSFWSVEPETGALTISLDKKLEKWWASVLIGDAEIDTSKVDSTRKVEEYDESTQAQIRKIMFDQQQKRQGLPTSDELSKESILEKARNLPGSPFLPKSMGGAGPDP